MNGKYIIIDDDGIEIPKIFTKNETHSIVAKGYNVISAGFFKVYYDNGIKITCFGRSVSLGIKSRPEIDSKILTTYTAW